MLTIKDLSASKELDRAAMTAVAGGSSPFGSSPFIDIDSNPFFDLSRDLVVQGQFADLNQSGNYGGVNLGVIYQEQDGSA